MLLISIADWSILQPVALFALKASQAPGEMMVPSGEMIDGMCHQPTTGIWIIVFLFCLLLIAAIAALVALTVYLLRHSRPPGPRGA